jgi:hypothetical protein
MHTPTTPREIPSSLRRAGTYPYLDNALNEYWLHAIDTAHILIDRHTKALGNQTYYQDQFADDFIAALKADYITRPIEILGEFELDNTLLLAEKKTDAAWSAYCDACTALKESPRGSQIHVRLHGTGEAMWGALIHCGGGGLNNCNTMAKTVAKPQVDAVVGCLLSFEAYLARKQAERDLLLLANYDRIRTLRLQPGIRLQDVEFLHNGTIRKMSFRISDIDESGLLSLVDGKLRGSGATFTGRKNACQIDAANLAPPVLPKAVPADELSGTLF